MSDTFFDLQRDGATMLGAMAVEVVDPVASYARLMERLPVGSTLRILPDCGHALPQEAVLVRRQEPRPEHGAERALAEEQSAPAELVVAAGKPL